MFDAFKSVSIPYSDSCLGFIYLGKRTLGLVSYILAASPLINEAGDVRERFTTFFFLYYIIVSLLFVRLMYNLTFSFSVTLRFVYFYHYHITIDDS